MLNIDKKMNPIDTNELDWKESNVKGFLSKSLLDLNNGGIKLIKVEPHSNYPIHKHPEKTEFIYVLEGEPQIVIGEQSYQGKAYDFFTLPFDVEHSIENNSNNECQLLVGSISK